MKSPQDIREAFRARFWDHRVPRNTKQFEDILDFFLTLRAEEMGEFRRDVEKLLPPYDSGNYHYDKGFFEGKSAVLALLDSKDV